MLSPFLARCAYWYNIGMTVVGAPCYLLLGFKPHDLSKLGEERIYLDYTSILLFIIKESQDRNLNRAGTWQQEQMQKP